MEGGSFGFPFGGDPEDLLRGIQEFAAQQAESVQEAQREQFATLTLNTAVELTSAALKQVQPSGSIDEQAVALRDAMRVLFPEAVALVSAARQGFMRESALGSCAVSLLDRVVVTLLPAVPRRVVEKLSARYIAGATLDDSRRVVAALNADGKLATVDVLGEEVSDETEAAAIAAEYVAALDAFERDNLDANVSIKPTGLGLKLSYELCKRNVEAVIAAAEPTNRFVRIDMEDSSTTDDTLRLFRELRDEGHGRVGPVLQASLKRTVADAATLAGASVRLCKGIYVEPESIQFHDDQAVRASFVQTLETLLDGDCYAAIATHDEWLVEQSLRILRERGVQQDRYEFQMLLGVRPELGDRIVADGHRLRIYVPYGRQWYEYSLRRLQENPKIAGYVAGDLGRSLFRRR